jgi:hypothetical protein
MRDRCRLPLQSLEPRSEPSATRRHVRPSSHAVHLPFRAFGVTEYRRMGYRSLLGLAPSRARTFEVFLRGPAPDDESSGRPLSWAWCCSRVSPGRNHQLPGLLSWGFAPLQRSRYREATYTGFASPDYAASSGFLNLLTPCSSRNPPALFRAGDALGVLPSEVSPSAEPVHLSVSPYPLDVSWSTLARPHIRWTASAG